MRSRNVQVLRRFSQACLLAVLVWLLLLGVESSAQDAYFSLEGDFLAGGDQHDLSFDLTRSVGSAEVLRFETFANGGGTNEAGDTISAGGIDSVLELFDSFNAQRGIDDDGSFTAGLDSLLSWPGVAEFDNVPLNPNPLAANSYRLNLSEFGNDAPGHWALDLVGPADAITLTDENATGTSSVTSLKFGTTGAGANSAVVDIAQFDTLNIAGALYVGNTGKGALTSLGLINSGFSILGQAAGSEGSVTLTASGNWLVSSDARIGDQGAGTLLIQGGAVGSFQGDVFLAWLSTGQGDVTVRDNGSLLFVGGDLEIGDGGIGTLRIEGGAWVNSSGVGSLSRDVIGDDPTTSSGTVTVTGINSRWDTDRLVVADEGDGTLRIEGGGRVNSTAAAIGTTTLSATGNATVTGANSLWDITGSLDVGTTQLSIINNATLTIENGGAVHVAGATTVNDTGTINLTGSTLQTGSLTSVGTGAFNWTAGTLELTASGLKLDTMFPDIVFGNNLTIGAGRTLLLSDLSDGLVVGDFGNGQLRIENGGSVTTATAVGDVIGWVSGSNGIIDVVGGAAGGVSTLAGTGGLLHVGVEGTATLNISTGGLVVSPGAFVAKFSNSSATVNIGGVWEDGMPSTWDVNGPLYVGGQPFNLPGGTATVTVNSGGLLDVSQETLLWGHGTINVDDPGTLWQAAAVTVGEGGVGTGQVILTNQAVVQSGNLDIGADSGDGQVIVNGLIPAGFGTRSTWNVTGSVDIGPTVTSGFGRGRLTVEQNGLMTVSDSASIHGTSDVASSLTVQTNGEIVITNNLNIGPFGTVNLLGSRIATGTFSSTGGTFNWTAGTLQITSEGIVLDSVSPHSVFGNSLTIGAGQKLIHSNPVTGSAEDALTIGLLSGAGQLIIENGGQVESVRSLVGTGGTSNGTAIVRGSGTSWTMSDQLRVAVLGSAVGMLTIQDGANVSSAGLASIGGSDSAHGTVVVTGAAPGGGSPSTWMTGGQLQVGRSNNAVGQLTIENGGVVSTDILFLGALDSANGTVTVQGTAPISNTPSTLTVAFDASVGGTQFAAGGTGKLTVQNGGTVNIANTLKVWPSGTVELLGSQINTGSFIVDPTSTFTHQDGTLTVDGGTFDPGTGGGFYTIDGVDTLDFPRVKLINGATTPALGSLVAGGSFAGGLSIESASSATFNGDMFLAFSGFSEGDILVSGFNSTLTIGGDLEVGDGWIGVLSVLDSGRVDSSGVGTQGRDVIGDDFGVGGGGGQATIANPGSQWVTDDLVIGEQAIGRLNALDGAIVDTLGDAFISRFGGSAGSFATIEHPGTRWNISGDLYVGGDTAGAGDTGKLTVQNGGKVEVLFGNTLKIWPTGTVELLGSEIVTGELVGEPGHTFTWTAGTLEITNEVVRLDTNTPHSVLGSSQTIGAGKKLIVSTVGLFNESLTVAHFGTGNLTIENGGDVESFRGIVGTFGTSNGTVTVRDPGSMWTITEQLRVGTANSAQGQLNVQNGAFVSADIILVGFGDNTNGTVIVDGPNSNLTSVSDLRVAQTGSATGELRIQNQGSVDSVTGLIAPQLGTVISPSGTVIVDGTNSAWNNTGNVTVGNNTGGSGTLRVQNGGAATIGGTLSVLDFGTVELGGGTVSATTFDINGGALQGNGTVNASVVNTGNVAPGSSPGTLTIQGSYVQTLFGTLEIEIGGTSLGQFDRLIVTAGSAVLNGTLAVSLVDPNGGSNMFTPSAGDSFEIISAAGGVTGSFTEWLRPMLPGRLLWNLNYDTANDRVLLEVLAALEADFDVDGDVDGDDLTIWEGAYGVSNGADADDDGDSDGADFLMWQQQFGSSVLAPLAAGANAAVPEPATYLMLASALLIFVAQQEFKPR